MNIIEKDTKIIGGGRDIIYVDGKYYLLSYDPAKVCYSEDLENWTEVNLNINYLKPKNIAYGNGIFIITGDYGGYDVSARSDKIYYYRSTDGINWELKFINSEFKTVWSLDNVKFINNKFLTFCSVAGRYIVDNQPFTITYFYESSDGIKWNKKVHEYKENKSAGAYLIEDVMYHNNIYIAVGRHGSIFLSSKLGNMSKINSNVNVCLESIIYAKSKFVIVGDEGTILTSNDGKNWIKQNTTTTAYLKKIRYSNGIFIACGYNGVILQSIDTINWENISTKKSGLRYGLTVNDNRFVISATKYSDSGTIPIFYFDVTRNLTDESEDSSIFFFNKNLEMLGIVDSFISLRWRRKYFEAGEFEIVFPVTDYLMEFLDNDVIVMKNNYTEAGIIETIEFDDDGENEEVTISGRFLSCLFERRIVKNKINFSGNTIEGMNTIIDSMTPLTDKWETEAITMSSKAVSFQCTYKNIYSYLCKLSEYSGIGFRIVPNVDSKVFMFEVYKGYDRTINQNENEQYSFSDDNFNIDQSKLTKSNKTKVNYVLVGGTGEDNNRILVAIDEGKSGFDLYETFSDQKSLSNNDLTTAQYKEKLKAVGEGKINDGLLNFETTVLATNDYKKKWDLGDIVNVKKDKWNLIDTKRIIEVEETIEDGKITVIPTLGSPFTSAWEDE